jgi:hypothetical protein
MTEQNLTPADDDTFGHSRARDDDADDDDTHGHARPRA